MKQYGMTHASMTPIIDQVDYMSSGSCNDSRRPYIPYCVLSILNSFLSVAFNGPRAESVPVECKYPSTLRNKPVMRGRYQTYNSVPTGMRTRITTQATCTSRRYLEVLYQSRFPHPLRWYMGAQELQNRRVLSSQAHRTSQHGAALG